jgi:hypothetical protein
MRTPRRILHQTYFGYVGREGSTENLSVGHDHGPVRIALWPADQCARAMHNEDCANGLWVINAKGSVSWPAYGDGELFSSKGNLDFDAALDAVQTGINEVWQTFQGDTITSFGALQKASFVACRVSTLSTYAHHTFLGPSPRGHDSRQLPAALQSR